MQQDNEQFDDLPEDLANALKRADDDLPLITARVDREILRMAKAQFAERRPPARMAGPAWLAAAAALLVAVFLFNTREPSVVRQDGLYADVDGSGRVDIADVLATARAAEVSGEISQAEIDAFAKQIVSLNPVGDAS
mgnify:CR=1 FL=1